MFFQLTIHLSRAACRLYAVDKINLLSRALCSTFTARDFFAHESHGETGTLSVRFIKYLSKEYCKYDPIIPQTIKYSEFYPLHDIRNFNNSIKEVPVEQIPKLIIFTYTYKTNGDLHKVAHALSKIDEFCTENIEKFDYDALVRTLQSFMFVVPNKITKLKFYELAVQRLVEEFDPSFPKEKFVQTCFYLGLWKRNMKSTGLMRQFIKSHLQTYLNHLSTLDFAIVSNATFKASLLVDENEFTGRLVQEAERSDFKDDGLMVTFIKSLRLNRVKSVKLYDKLKSHLLSGEMDNMHFKGLIHCFAYFAEGLWNHPAICKTMVSKCLERLEEIGSDGQVFNDMRAKDLATFLWCCANLSITDLNESDLNFIEEIILKKIDRQEYRNCPDELIDAAFSLWMLNHKSQDIISSILRLKSIPTVKKSERIKLDGRFRLLLNCVQIEKPEWMMKRVKDEKPFLENRKAPDYLVRNRTSLQLVGRILEERKSELGIISIDIVCPISEINVVGYLLETKEGKCFLEVLEENQMLQYDNKPIAIVQLKANLLRILGYKVHMIGHHECKIEEELLSTLRDKLNYLDTTLNIKKAVV